MKFIQLLFFQLATVFFVECVFWRNAESRIFRGKHLNLSSWLLANLAEGGQLALQHCQRQFHWERWNCPRHEFYLWNRQLSKRPTRELAYLNAIISAAIVHTIALNCSKGDSCPALRQRRNVLDQFWSNHMSDMIDYGEYIVQSYLESYPHGSDPASYATRHNIAVGRRAVRSASTQKCRCHGMSGTCTTKTCWTQLAPFTVVADELRKRYDVALRLDFEGGRGVKIGNSASAFRPLVKTPQAIKNDELVFLHDSPDYCKPNVSSGWPGTRGRTCTRSIEDDISAKRSCRNLCKKCGYNVRRKVKGKKLCNCKFTWCCEVTCEPCEEQHIEHYCA